MVFSVYLLSCSEKLSETLNNSVYALGRMQRSKLVAVCRYTYDRRVDVEVRVTKRMLVWIFTDAGEQIRMQVSYRCWACRVLLKDVVLGFVLNCIISIVQNVSINMQVFRGSKS